MTPIHQFMDEVVIRIAIDLDLFNLLIKSEKPQTLEDLTKATGADGVLLGVPSANPPHTDHLLMYSAARLLRSLGAIGAVGEVGETGEEAYVPTKVTRTFVIPPLAAGVQFWYVPSFSYKL